jgi:DNA-binding helix-hairpin-helix protein with protein kinase domain
LLVVLLGLILFAAAGAIGGEDRRAERAKRRAAHQAARAQFDQLASRARSHAGSSTFAAKKQQLAALREDYQQLSGQEQAELSRLQTTAESRQRQQFLDRCYIESAVIPGVGPAKKAALRSFGIETAADVTWQRVIVLKGFGEVKTHAMLEWRVACEKRFVFNPRIAVTDSDKRAVAAQFAARRRALETELSRGASDLQRIRQDALAEAATLQPALEDAAQKLAQAEADANVV